MAFVAERQQPPGSCLHATAQRHDLLVEFAAPLLEDTLALGTVVIFLQSRLRALLSVLGKVLKARQEDVAFAPQSPKLGVCRVPLAGRCGAERPRLAHGISFKADACGARTRHHFAHRIFCRLASLSHGVTQDLRVQILRHGRIRWEQRGAHRREFAACGLQERLELVCIHGKFPIVASYTSVDAARRIFALHPPFVSSPA
mmetsp:Transcript_107842/g.303862  ORF Transcript_107842/g.303862 Transcript_107842/m.303862 type:complete len:201 (-) Transcript_107842:5-607(-)